MTDRSNDTPDRDLALSLVRDDLPFRLLRRVGLIPAEGLGTGRRAIFFALLTWLPIAIWAATNGRALPGGTAEPLIEHFGVHVRCLVAIPILILAQGFAHRTTTWLLPWFVKSGVIAREKIPRLKDAVRGVARLRNGTLPWIVIAGLVLAWTVIEPVSHDVDEVVWANEGPPPSTHLGFGGSWFLYVAQPIYIVLALAWLWRLVLLVVLFRKIVGLGLDLAPTHPDRVGGLGFVERFAMIFGPVAFVLSAVIGSRWAHQIMYHDLPIKSLHAPGIVFLLVALVLFLAPLLVFAGPLIAAKKRAELEYGALVRRHDDLVRRKWIEGEEVDDEGLLSAPELGPVADTVSLYQAVGRMRAAPIGKRAVMSILVPAIVPLALVLAIKIPLSQVLRKLLHGLV